MHHDAEIHSNALKLDFGVALISVSLCFDALVCFTSTTLFRLLSCFVSPSPLTSDYSDTLE